MVVAPPDCPTLGAGRDDFLALLKNKPSALFPVGDVFQVDQFSPIDVEFLGIPPACEILVVDDTDNTECRKNSNQGFQFVPFCVLAFEPERAKSA